MLNLSSLKDRLKARQRSHRSGITMQVQTVQELIAEIERLADLVQDSADIAEENARLRALVGELVGALEMAYAQIAKNCQICTGQEWEAVMSRLLDALVGALDEEHGAGLAKARGETQ